MTDDTLIRRTNDESAAAESSHWAEWDARNRAAPLNAMGDNVTIQKNWQELIRPNKLQVAAGADLGLHTYTGQRQDGTTFPAGLSVSELPDK